MTDVIYEMSSKKLGMTTVQEEGRLARRHQRRRSAQAAGARRRRGAEQDRRRGHERASPHHCVERTGRERRWRFWKSARSLRWLSSDAEQTVEGVVHLHDLWGVELI